MAERRITEIMRQRRRCDNSAEVGGKQWLGACGQRGPAPKDFFAYFFSKRSPNRTHLKAVCKPCMDEVVFRQRMYLRFVLQPSKGVRENDAIVVLFEGAPAVCVAAGFLSGALRRKKLLPVHEINAQAWTPQSRQLLLLCCHAPHRPATAPASCRVW